MRRFDALKLTQDELAASKHVPITHLNSPSVFESKNGMLGTVLKLEGVPFDTEKEEQLNIYKGTWHRALMALDGRFCVYVTVHRRKENQVLEGQFESGFAKALDARYHAKFKSSSMYANDIYLTLAYKGIATGKAGKGLNLIQKLSNRAIKGAREASRQAQMKALKEAVHQLKESLSVFGPCVLGEKDGEVGHSELLTFLGLIVNGGHRRPYLSTPFAPAISMSIKGAKKNLSLYPYGNLAQYLPAKQIFFGSHVQFQGALEDDKVFGAIVTVKRYGTVSACIMLDTLLHLDSEFIQTNTFAIEDEGAALSRIKRQMVKKMNVGDPAVSQIGALHEARDLLASGQLSMGHHHNTLLLLASSLKELEANVAKAIKCYSDAGLVAVKETIGQAPAFWAQVPTNLNYIARSSLITSENFVDFAPLHNYRTGYRDGNHLGSAVTLLETPSKAPYFFNYHVKGSKNNPSKGHALIIGGNNSGKTALMSFLDAQMSRYGGNTFYFDRDRGAEIYVRAMGGHYAILSPEAPEETCFNPLQLPDTQGNRQFNRALLGQLCKNEGEGELGAAINEQLKRCVDYAYDKLAKEHRVLSNAVNILPMGFSRWPELRRWLRGSGKHADGEYAYIFDNETDKLALHTMVGLDMTHFLDREPPNVRTALLMYLFHRVHGVLDGQRTSILLDEGWQYFIDPYWKSALERWLPTFRKKNAHIVIATQSPSSVVRSPVRAQVLDNAATLIFFANPQAKAEDYINGLGLTAPELSWVAENDPAQRLFLVKQEHTSCLCRLDLSGLPGALAVLSGNSNSVRLLGEARREAGDNPEGWLPLFYQRLGEQPL